MKNPLIQIQKLTKIYRTGETQLAAIHEVDTDIYPGEFVAIMGPSGAGKSTLLHLLGCLDTPTSGKYLLDGQDVSHLSPTALAEVRNKKIGFVFQDFDLLPNLTARDNVMLPMVYGGISEEEAIKKSDTLLEQVELGDRKTFFPNELSGGQQQRVAIARAMAMNPLIILADEPTGNLDTATSERILNLFLELNKTSQTTLVIVTHEYSIGQQAQRRLTITDGRLAEE